MEETGHITQLLSAARAGDRDALNTVFTYVYDEIRRIAHRQLRRLGRADTLNTTAVVHEAYLKLTGAAGAPWEDRAHFLNVAAAAMRQVLLDHARARTRKKRGGGVRTFLLDGHDAPVEEQAADFIELDAALRRLSALNARLGRVIELRFFGGLSVEEAAKVLGVTDRTVKRDWAAARAFLYKELAEDRGASPHRAESEGAS
ncbi:MAG: ECF-type sigma factor [bacterium]